MRVSRFDYIREIPRKEKDINRSNGDERCYNE